MSGKIAGGLPARIQYCECWARDGLQSLPTVIPTERKIEMLDGMIEAGFPEIEVTSFAHPKLLPQFADCAEVLKGIRRDTDTRFRVFMPNLKGWERYERECHDAGSPADKIILMISASEEYNQRNLRMSHAEGMAHYAPLMKRAHDRGVEIVGCVGAVFGCAIQGDMPLEPVEKMVRYFHDEGAQLVMLGDTTGMSNPRQTEQVLSSLIEKFPDTEFLVHFHDTRGTGLVNSYVAASLGVRWIDGSLGAIGGQPSSREGLAVAGNKGNQCTEDFLAMMDECGVETGVDIDRLLELGRRAEEIVGFAMRSNVVRSGRVEHRPGGDDRSASGPADA